MSRFQFSSLSWFLLLVVCSTVFCIFIQPVDDQYNNIKNDVSTAAPCICAEDGSSSVLASTPKPPDLFPQNESAGAKIVPSKTLQGCPQPDLSKPEGTNVKTNETNTNSTVNNNPSVTSNTFNAYSDDKSFHIQPRNPNLKTNETKTNSTVNNNSSVTSNTFNAQSGNKTFHIQPRGGISGTTTRYNENVTTAAVAEVTPSNIPEKELDTVSDSNKIDTEVEDLNNASGSYANPNHLPPVPFNLSEAPNQGINRETVLIDDGENTEDILRNSSANEENFSDPGVPLVQGQLAAILAGVFVAISVIAYVGMLSWRRYLENRYGNRQMLVNEDEFNDDFRHFSI